MFFGELNSALSLFDRLGSWRKARKRIDTVATRFVSLFEAHGIHRNQIFRLLGHRAPIADLQNDDALLRSLTGELLDQAASLFAVRRDWLDCATDEIYPLQDFYKKPAEFALFLEGLLKLCVGDIYGVVLVSESDRNEDTALIVIQETATFLDEKPVYRYHLCNNWLFDYWKSRAFLTACVAAAWNRNVYLMGRRVPIDVIRKYSLGMSFLQYEFDSALPTSGRHWYPEDMAVKPESFLDGLSEGGFGRRHAIDLWLHLDQQGFMKTGLPYNDVSRSFKSRLGISHS